MGRRLSGDGLSSQREKRRGSRVGEVEPSSPEVRETAGDGRAGTGEEEGGMRRNPSSCSLTSFEVSSLMLGAFPRSASSTNLADLISKKEAEAREGQSVSLNLELNQPPPLPTPLPALSEESPRTPPPPNPYSPSTSATCSPRDLAGSSSKASYSSSSSTSTKSLPRNSARTTNLKSSLDAIDLLPSRHLLETSIRSPARDGEASEKNVSPVLHPISQKSLMEVFDQKVTSRSQSPPYTSMDSQEGDRKRDGEKQVERDGTPQAVAAGRRRDLTTSRCDSYGVAQRERDNVVEDPHRSLSFNHNYPRSSRAGGTLT